MSAHYMYAVFKEARQGHQIPQVIVSLHMGGRDEPRS